MTVVPEPADLDLANHLSSVLSGPLGAALATTILALADAAAVISTLVANGPLAGSLGEETGEANADGDRRKQLDILANERILANLKQTPTAFFASEEEDVILALDPGGKLAVAVDPLDGSSNIDVNVSIGTIFSIFAASAEGASASFFRPGREQIAAGYFVYGPHTALVLTTGDGVQLFVLDRAVMAFRMVRSRVSIPREAVEFAINTSNYRHWFEPVQNLYRRLRRRSGRTAWQGFQYAMGGFARGGNPSHLYPRRCVPVPGRPPGRIRTRTLATGL